MNIGKKELMKCVAECIAKNRNDDHTDKKQAKLIVNDIISTISNALAENGKVRISGIGTLVIVERATRTGKCVGRNYKTPARNYVKFSMSKVLKDKLDTN